MLSRPGFHTAQFEVQCSVFNGMAWLQSAYSIRFNHRHKLIDHVLSGRDRAQLVEGSGHCYLRSACDDVPLNPARARLLRGDISEDSPKY